MAYAMVQTTVRIKQKVYDALNVEAVKRRLNISDIIREKLDTKTDLSPLFLEQFEQISERLAGIENSQVSILKSAIIVTERDKEYATLWRRFYEFVLPTIDEEDKKVINEYLNIIIKNHDVNSYENEIIAQAERWRNIVGLSQVVQRANNIVMPYLNDVYAWYSKNGGAK